MQNLEIKVALADKESMLEAIKKLGADYQYTMRQQDYYFSVGERKQKLRVIDGSEFQLVTYHRIETQGRKDSQYAIERMSAQAAADLLKSRKAVRMINKTRELWLYAHTRIHVDCVDGLGDFLELETVLAEISPEEGTHEFHAVVAGLGIDAGNSIAASYSDLAAKNI